MAAATSSTAPLPAIYSLSPPHGQITADDHGGYVVICAWIMMCFFTISVLTRLLTRTIPVVTIGSDDIMSGSSMVFGIAQTVAVHISAVNGLGQHQSSLSPKSFRTYATSYYAANILYFLAVYFAKISLVMIIMRLSPARFVQRLCLGILLLITAWIIAEIFAFAFQSPTPQVWNYTQTRRGGGGVNTPALYYTASAGDIISDLLVILLPAHVIWQVQISLKKRLAIISVFAVRLSVIICSAIRIHVLTHYVTSTDRSWHAVGLQTWTQIIQCLSIITACIPCLKPFLEALESGFMDLSLGKIRGDTYRAHSGSGGLGTGQSSSNQANQKSSNTSSSTTTAAATAATNAKRKSRRLSSAGVVAKNDDDESYLMDSLSSAAAAEHSSDRALVGPGPAIEEDPPPNPHQPRHLHHFHHLHRHLTGHPERTPSVTESQRVLTRKSTDGDEASKHSWEMPPAETKGGWSRGGRLGLKLSDDAIRVTREVEIRDEDPPHAISTEGDRAIHSRGSLW